MKKRRFVPCVAASCLLLMCGALIVGGLVFGLGRLAVSLPTPQPRPTFTIGETYWVGALLPPPGLPSGLTMPNATIYNKPNYSINDPSVTIIGVLGDTTPVKLTGIQDDWCYVEAVNEFSSRVEGWMDCIQLLDYEPTPFPTPNMTPERP